MTNILNSIRNVKIEDAKDILKIYEYYILNTAITFEISVPALEEFEERIRSISSSYPYIVLEENNKIIGYAYANTFKAREAYKYSVEISIYLDHNHIGKGYGKLLYNELEKKLESKGITNIYSCITYSDNNDLYVDNKSEKFHEHLGFKLVGKMNKCGIKFDRWYSVIWMEKIIKEH